MKPKKQIRAVFMFAFTAIITAVFLFSQQKNTLAQTVVTIRPPSLAPTTSPSLTSIPTIALTPYSADAIEIKKILQPEFDEIKTRVQSLPTPSGEYGFWGNVAINVLSNALYDLFLKLLVYLIPITVIGQILVKLGLWQVKKNETDNPPKWLERIDRFFYCLDIIYALLFLIFLVLFLLFPPAIINQLANQQAINTIGDKLDQINRSVEMMSREISSPIPLLTQTPTPVLFPTPTPPIPLNPIFRIILGICLFSFAALLLWFALWIFKNRDSLSVVNLSKVAYKKKAKN